MGVNKLAFFKKTKSVNQALSCLSEAKGEGSEDVTAGVHSHIERMGATASKEAIRIPISQIPTVSSNAQVGSPLDLL